MAAFAVAVAVIYLLGVAVGWDATVERLRQGHLGWIAAACGSTLLCLALWTVMWREILSAMEIDVGYRQLVVTFYAATFANYVTPMGQAGGEPFVAYVLSRDTEASYEESLASVLIADVLRLLPFFTVAAVGVAYLVFRASLPDTLESSAALLLALAVLMPVAVVLVWRNRRRLEGYAVDAVRPLERRTDRLSAEGVAKRIDRLNTSMEKVAEEPRALLYAVVAAYVGWILFALPLYFSGLALDLPVSLLLVAFAVPVTIVTSFTPLPGGLGAIEGTLVVILTLMAAMTASEALAVTTVYRLTSYWIVVAVGGAAALWVVYRA